MAGFIYCSCVTPDPYTTVGGVQKCQHCYHDVAQKERVGPRPSLDEYAMILAEAASARSEDPFTRVGTCAVRADKTIAALGYNGPPPGVDIDWSSRDERRKWVVHAETNAMRYVKPGEVFMVASTLLPCPQCMLILASMGVKRIVYRDALDPAVYDGELSLEIARESGVAVTRLS